MTLWELKRSVREQPTTATIISDGCRDYVVEIQRTNGAGLLRDRRGRTVRFASLAEAKRTMQKADVADICLSVRIAADEACAGPSANEPQFATIQLATNY